MNVCANSIERQLTILLRRGNRVHLATQNADVTLDRSAYGILCQLADEGPQRLGTLAGAFQLDPSTITRQVQPLVERGLAVRASDPVDGRAYILDLTASGFEVLKRTRGERRARLQRALEDWSEADLTDLARLLKEFNASVDRLPPNDPASSGPSVRRR
jgi:DNA-binding MarR family transcriptional regulator